MWPWIVQMGFPTHRAGWYTPFWLDRVLFGITAHSADRIIPEHPLPIYRDVDFVWAFVLLHEIQAGGMLAGSSAEPSAGSTARH